MQCGVHHATHPTGPCWASMHIQSTPLMPTASAMLGEPLHTKMPYWGPSPPCCLALAAAAAACTAKRRLLHRMGALLLPLPAVALPPWYWVAAPAKQRLLDRIMMRPELHAFILAASSWAMVGVALYPQKPRSGVTCRYQKRPLGLSWVGGRKISGS